ncbi:MAG: pip [Rhodospirillales bacterium]|nr:pip [Rhodospirillales bacterium]
MQSSPAAIGRDTDELSFLYPASEPDSCGLLPVGDGHEIWWEASGNPAGIPVIYLHGGPGLAARPVHRRFFDPAFYRIVLMHQRGCGKSRPLASIHANTTWTLVDDIERLRLHLGVERWLVAGGSWGSCLALAYGEAHPERCLGFRLRGVILGRVSDIAWWWNGTRMLFPEAYDDLLAFLPEAERHDPMSAYCGRLVDTDPRIYEPAARALKEFSGRTVHIRPNAATVEDASKPEIAVPLSRLFAHYTLNGFFLRENQLMQGLQKLVHLPCAIVQGRYDVTTPTEAAWTLHKAWPGSTVRIIAEGAHDELDPPLARAVFDAHEALKVKLAR